MVGRAHEMLLNQDISLDLQVLDPLDGGKMRRCPEEVSPVWDLAAVVFPLFPRNKLGSCGAALTPSQSSVSQTFTDITGSVKLTYLSFPKHCFS